MAARSAPARSSYAAIGSRKTPASLKPVMASIASALEDAGYVLRSGSAAGADVFWESGVRNPVNKEIYIPRSAIRYFNRRSDEPGLFVSDLQPGIAAARELAAQHHPIYSSLKPFVQDLHARNSMQLYGAAMDTPSDFVLAYAPYDRRNQPTGGTAQALRIAQSQGIPSFNLADPDVLEALIAAHDQGWLVPALTNQRNSSSGIQIVSKHDRPDFLGMRAHEVATSPQSWGAQTTLNILNAKPGAPGALGNPYLANDVRGGKYTRAEATLLFEHALRRRAAEDQGYRDWLLTLPGQRIGYYKPDEDWIHLHALERVVPSLQQATATASASGSTQGARDPVLRIVNGNIAKLGPNDRFVFGSNLAGRHGRGAARLARESFGAEYGVGVGPTGQTYAFPTKDEQLRTLSLDRISSELDRFLQYASQNPEQTFYLTRIGQGLAGYSEDQIRPLVERAQLPQNVRPWWEWESQPAAAGPPSRPPGPPPDLPDGPQPASKQNGDGRKAGDALPWILAISGGALAGAGLYGILKPEDQPVPSTATPIY